MMLGALLFAVHFYLCSMVLFHFRQIQQCHKTSSMRPAHTLLAVASVIFASALKLPRILVPKSLPSATS